MDGWVGGGYVDEWGGAARREGWMNGACVDVGGMAGMLQSRSASSLNPMPQHWSINKEMTQQLIPSKLQLLLINSFPSKLQLLLIPSAN